jgi:2-haloacid dehalogenase
VNAIPQIKALVFDAYGTLFDVYSVGALCDELFPGRGKELNQLWRTKQLEYTWLRSLMNAYADFERVTREALGYACGALKLDLDANRGAQLMAAYHRLAPFADVPAALAAFEALPLTILSNGSPSMLNAAVDHAGLRRYFRHVISVDEVKIFKPSPSVYRLAPQKLGLPAAQIGFVSSNCWDVAGATRFGFHCFWINRTGAPLDALDFTPFAIVQSLTEVGSKLK